MFQFTPSNGLLNTTTFPTTPVNETAARQQFMTVFDQIKDEMNSGATSAIGLHNMARQAIINGNFDIWQRGTTFTNPSGYTTDRWQVLIGADGGVLPTSTIHSQQPLTSGDIQNAYYFHRIAPNGAGSGFGVNAYYFISQKIENGTRYLCGSGKKITVSFWARSNIAGKRVGVSCRQDYGTGGTPSAFEDLPGSIFNLTSSWAKYTFTFTSNTLVGKTFGTNNDDNLRISIFEMWGTSIAAQFFGGGTAETFGGAGNIDIAQVQVCAGDQALPFQPRSFADELALCQRYYERFDSANGRVNLGTASADSSTNLHLPILFKTEKRISPTFVQGGVGFRILPTVTATTLSLWESNKVSAVLLCSGSGFINSQAYLVQSRDTGGWIAFDAEL